MQLTAIDQLSVSLMVHSSRFARSLSRRAGSVRSLVAMRVLSNLEQVGDLRIGELAEREFIAQPAMTATVNRLEGDGLVERLRDEGDARASLVHLTRAGAELIAAFRLRAADVARPAMEELSAEEIRTLDSAVPLLARLVAALESA
ncbi:MarR family winged helix-turn-helix transcriptional regulator [Microbacterium sp.]|jgi:DNA-binding MarR family transcriptional regulator|uniref:MarR family winged helix-turn-helix transcriptional regulator n=1 Tax=Microbacterium sp. TaxID=51671 RepID=UPI0025FDB68F|nr:MarR family transcriptional regulator [Microbacterium sp.]